MAPPHVKVFSGNSFDPRCKKYIAVLLPPCQHHLEPTFGSQAPDDHLAKGSSPNGLVRRMEVMMKITASGASAQIGKGGPAHTMTRRI